MHGDAGVVHAFLRADCVLRDVIWDSARPRIRGLVSMHVTRYVARSTHPTVTSIAKQSCFLIMQTPVVRYWCTL